MSLELSDRPVALVTGSFRGIGRACAMGLGKAGFNLLLNDRDVQENRELVQSIETELTNLGADCLPVLGNVAELELHQAMVDAAIARWGRLDCLVNNAGVSHCGVATCWM
jgi:3-oxoacyl-[acyl-carrier protein] reductase